MTRKKREETRSRVESVTGELRQEILNGRHRSGSRLHIADLAKRFGVSISVMRESLGRLVTYGLVRTIEQRGFRVAPLSLVELQDLVRVRARIEGLAARWSVEQGDEHWLAELMAASAEIDAPGFDDQKLSRQRETYFRFHRLLVGATGSYFLGRIRTALGERNDRYWALASHLRGATFFRDPVRRRGIVAAAAARDAALVERLVEQQMHAAYAPVIQYMLEHGVEALEEAAAERALNVTFPPRESDLSL